MISYRYDDYVKDLIFGIYEDENLMKRTGTGFGFYIDSDVFVMLSLGFSEKYDATVEEKRNLHRVGQAIAACCIHNAPDYDPVIPFNNQISILLFADSEQAMKALLPTVEKTAVDSTERYFSGKPVRIGEGNLARGLAGIKESYNQSVRAIRAGAIFKQNHKLLRFNNMEIYSILDEIMRVHGPHLSKTVLSRLSQREIDVLCMYYECKEDVPKTADSLGITEKEVTDAFVRVTQSIGLDVYDSEDNFKLHLVMLTVKVQRYMTERGN
ncbi:MAG: hypothetical protein ACERKO_00445 [Acetanaerobacterium sp.]